MLSANSSNTGRNLSKKVFSISVSAEEVRAKLFYLYSVEIRTRLAAASEKNMQTAGNYSVDEIPHAMKTASTKSNHFNGISFEKGM